MPLLFGTGTDDGTVDSVHIGMTTTTRLMMMMMMMVMMVMVMMLVVVISLFTSKGRTAGGCETGEGGVCHKTFNYSTKQFSPENMCVQFITKWTFFEVKDEVCCPLVTECSCYRSWFQTKRVQAPSNGSWVLSQLVTSQSPSSKKDY